MCGERNGHASRPAAAATTRMQLAGMQRHLLPALPARAAACTAPCCGSRYAPVNHVLGVRVCKEADQLLRLGGRDALAHVA